MALNTAGTVGGDLTPGPAGPADDTGAGAAPILEMRNIAKRFDATQALEDVSLALYSGEVHALLGENGAGKSTLIKIMTGVHQPDRGEILLAGKPIAIRDTAEAQRHGIAAIYQEPMLFPDLNVAENIFISHQGRGAVVGWRSMFREAEAILAELGVALDVRSPARGLTLAAQQSVEIAKAISLNVRVLIMDEPTASLSAHEVGQLFKLVRDLRDQGVAILFVSHRLEEVFEIADKVTVFRDGRLISTAAARRGDARSAPSPTWSAGRWAFSGSARRRRWANCSSRCADLRRDGRLRGCQLRRPPRRGAGLRRADRRRPHRCRPGALRHRTRRRPGSIKLDGKTVTIRSPRGGDAHRHRLCLRGPAPARPVAADVDLRQHHAARSLKRYLNGLGLIRRGRGTPPPRPIASGCRSARPSIDLPVAKLSGGNQQKVMLSKWLNTRPVAAHPRRADPRHRRRRQGRGPRHHRRTGQPRASASSSSPPTCPKCWP